MKTEIIKVNPQEFGLQEKDTKELTKGLDIVLKEREQLEQEFSEVSKLEITPENLKMFKELRLKIVKNRTQGIMKWHKQAKDYFLRGGQFVDAIKRKEIAVNEAMEQKLLEGEKYFERLEQERKEKLKAERLAELQKYVDTEALNIDLAEMDDEVYNAYLTAKKIEYQKRIEEEKRLEQERIERERKQKLHNERKEVLLMYWQFAEPELKEKDLSEIEEKEWKNIIKSLEKEKEEYEAEQERIRLENERLKKEREELERKRKEAELKAKKEMEERLRKEREKQAELEAELRAKEEAERKRLAEIEAKKQAELQKGDKEKMEDLKADLILLKTKYKFKSKAYQKKYADVGILIEKIITHLEK